MTLLALAHLTGLAAPAQATFPGRNGLLTVEITRTQGRPCTWPGCIDLRIVGVDPRTGRRARLPVCAGAVCRDDQPAWSPGGRRLAFQRSFGDAELSIFQVPRAGGVPQPVVNGASPAWSPDGRRLAVSDLTTRTPRIFTVGLEGAERRRVRGADGANTDWSSRGLLAFERQRALSTRIFTTRPSGRGLRRLTNDGSSYSPSWSPNGRRIAYFRFNEALEQRSVWVMRADGSHKRRLVRNADSPAWSPDGRYVAFTRGRRLYRVNVSGKPAPRLIHTARGPYLPSLGRLDWQPLPRRGRK